MMARIAPLDRDRKVQITMIAVQRKRLVVLNTSLSAIRQSEKVIEQKMPNRIGWGKTP
ncbi:hypothetical protein GALL_553710 [mine drainage metagenome]|uniref:Uncharacterized protein n=1 Tax=mine drainage metagenome TaxID=410659 RepID=A0A1J5PCY3_9ZZZZ